MEEALLSVISQTYENIEIIVIDDGSTDGSREIIKKVCRKHPWLQVKLLTENGGNCKAFNSGLRMSSGEYIIDFATDDRMLPGHVNTLVQHFSKLPATVGVLYTDACYINESGKIKRPFYRRDKAGGIHRPMIAEGNVFKDVVSRYFICTPTMMMRRSVLEQLEGYDETLAYEDFDFWVRASRERDFAFLDYRGMHVRRVDGSMGRRQYTPGDKQLHTTYLVLRKAWDLCRDADEKEAVINRVRHEHRLAVITDNKTEARLLYDFLREIEMAGLAQKLLHLFSHLPFRKTWIRKSYHFVSYRIKLLR